MPLTVPRLACAAKEGRYVELTEAIYERRAVRDYTAEPVSEVDLRAVIDAAVQAPSGMNRQPWSFVVVSGRGALERLSMQAKAHLLKTLDPQLAGARDHLAAADFNIFYNAPVMVAVCATEQDAMAVKDCCLAAQNLMLAARERGLGTCWIGFAESWLNTPEGRGALGAPEHYTVVAPIILGHARAFPDATPRRPAHVRHIREAEVAA
ncbi:MAG: nitroreductase family protein [Parcubacteria group bacterium]